MTVSSTRRPATATHKQRRRRHRSAECDHPANKLCLFVLGARLLRQRYKVVNQPYSVEQLLANRLRAFAEPIDERCDHSQEVSRLKQAVSRQRPHTTQPLLERLFEPSGNVEECGYEPLKCC
jgi:hypothetical protein